MKHHILKKKEYYFLDQFLLRNKFKKLKENYFMEILLRLNSFYLMKKSKHF
jgi:hypothetical protein